MAQYTGMILTKKGRDLQAKAEAGATLTFTKAKIGDGQLGQGQSLENLNDLISPQKTLAISSVQAESGGLCRIRTNITNQGITQGFYVREIGLFAQDPDLGEILYAIATAAAADYLPPEGGSTIVNNQFDIIVIVGNASSISATINPSGLVNQEQLTKLQGQVDSLAKTVVGSAVVTGLAFSVVGLTASYTTGTAYVSGVKFDVAAGSIQLNANQGQYIYLDTDGKVKGTTDQSAAQAKCLLWYFSTNATDVITSTDRRSVIDSTQFVKQTEVAANGANKIPRLDAQGKGVFSITGDASTVAGKTVGNAASNVPLSNGTLNTNLNADMVDGYHVGTGSNQIPTRDANGKLVADQLARLKITKSGKDANGKFTQVDYKRESDNTLFMRSVLSNPDANGNYQTDTWTYYKTDGTTVAETKVWTITYDADGDITSVA
ncbi:phage tail-collar fiber domain-containing protein [Brevibacillus sp. SAFN-007a]|uniref:phage tail-collar fiber domain-containing protein n=1 Tax=Brevibacillus sp. SAFN-007a TaxID=3436862 RepID=UPI003F7E6072